MKPIFLKLAVSIFRLLLSPRMSLESKYRDMGWFRTIHRKALHWVRPKLNSRTIVWHETDRANREELAFPWVVDTIASPCWWSLAFEHRLFSRDRRINIFLNVSDVRGNAEPLLLRWNFGTRVTTREIWKKIQLSIWLWFQKMIFSRN